LLTIGALQNSDNVFTVVVEDASSAKWLFHFTKNFPLLLMILS
jgi:hypothetical protein